MTERRFILCSRPGDFDAILRWRMRQHKRKQDREAERLTAEIVEGIVDALAMRTLAQGERSGVLPFPESRQSVRTRQ